MLLFKTAQFFLFHIRLNSKNSFLNDNSHFVKAGSQLIKLVTCQQGLNIHEKSKLMELGWALKKSKLV